MEIKKWLEDGTKLKVEETAFRKAPPLPFIVFDDDIEKRGADSRLAITEHDLTIYYAWSKKDESIEKELETLLENKDASYTKETSYNKEDDFYTTTYTLHFIEKESKHGI